jgi:hypothetical protein
MLCAIDDAIPPRWISQTFDGSVLIEGERRHQKAEEIDDRAAAKYLLYERTVVITARASALKGYPGGDSNDKKEERKNQISRSPSIPLCVLEGWVDRAPRTGIVDEQHPRDSEASEDVE